jgi:hypothetical protein
MACIDLVVGTLNALDGVESTHIPVQEQAVSFERVSFLFDLPYRTVADCARLQSLIFGNS